MLSEEVNEGVRIAQRRVAILVARVVDDELRESISSLMGSATSALLARNEPEANFHMDTTAKQAVRVLEQIGVVLRRHLM